MRVLVAVAELWYFSHGRGQLSIPVGTAFQFRSLGYEPLAAIGLTMPPWPGEGEAELVDGPWEPTVPAGPH